jgi:branched-chain amino acid aminotransferase
VARTLGRGAGGLRLPSAPRPSVLATAREGLPEPAGVRTILSTRVRRNEHSPASAIKSLSYLDNVLARLEAEAAGGQDALLLNTKGRLAEATTANVFAVLDGVPVTPPVAEGCLPGVARRALMAAMTVTERPLEPGELFAAEDIFLTASTGVRAVLSIDGHEIGKGESACRRAAHELLSDPAAG